MGNSTEDRNATFSEAFNPRLSIERNQGGLATVTIIFCSLNILLSITESVGNILILIALRKVTSLHSPTKLLFQCLAITDLAVGLISQPLYVIDLINFSLWNIFSILYDITWASSICLCSVSLDTTTALSVDRLLALLLKLRYRHVVTLKRVRVVVFCFWWYNKKEVIFASIEVQKFILSCVCCEISNTSVAVLFHIMIWR